MNSSSTSHPPLLIPLQSVPSDPETWTGRCSQLQRMVTKILCVAEKPSIAKAVATHLSGGRVDGHAAGRTNPWLRNYEFDYTFPQWGPCHVVMTSVAGHLQSVDFTERYMSWSSCSPDALFDADIRSFVDKDKQHIADNIARQARGARALFIWTDCDREGEHIGSEIVQVAIESNARLSQPGNVVRARFSNIERQHIITAARNPVALDSRQASAVSARIELDLRIGSAFTRMQTLSLKPMIQSIAEDVKVISYGSCQFPTLGFVVERYFQVQNFVPEPFWCLKLSHTKDDIVVTFTWARHRLFDRLAVVVLLERCLAAGRARVLRVHQKPASKWKPLPLTTVELQKMGSKFLRMDSKRVMEVAEQLYQKGFISYPRTETDQFDAGMDLKRLVEKQTPSGAWGACASRLIDGDYRTPRNGRNNDKAHPPIHPVNYVSPESLEADHRKVHEFVVRRFLACCSDDAKGTRNEVEIGYGSEHFKASGLTVLERNYLEVYPYEKWTSTEELPPYEVGETFEPSEARIDEGQTTKPGYLTEPELIGLMDANGIGTDATMAEHIAKIKERQYVNAQTVGGRSRGNTVDADDQDEPAHRPSARGGRGRGRGRGGRVGGASTRDGSSPGGMNEFIPTTLGVALYEGYEKMGFETSLTKPFLRKEMELKMKAICEGHSTRADVVHQSLDMYREVYMRTNQRMDVMKTSFRRYLLGTV